MNTADTMRMLTDKDDERRLQDPAHHLLRRLFLRDGGLRRSRPARHHLSRTLGLHLAARPADRRCRRCRRCDPPAGDQARPRRAAVPGRADRPRRPARTAGHVDGRRPRALSRGLKDYIVWHERSPGIGLLAGWRGADGGQGKAPANPIAGSSTATSKTAASGGLEIPEAARYYKLANRDYLDWAIAARLPGQAEQIVLQLYSEPLRKFRLAAEGHGTRQPPDHMRARVDAPISIRCRSGTRRSSAAADRRDGFPLHAITQRPMQMYHSWGIAERLAAPDPGAQSAVHRAQAAASGWALPTATGCGSKSATAG